MQQKGGGTSSCLGREHGMIRFEEHCVKHMVNLEVSKWDVSCVDVLVNDLCHHLIKKILQIIHSSRRIATQNWRKEPLNQS